MPLSGHSLCLIFSPYQDLTPAPRTWPITFPQKDLFCLRVYILPVFRRPLLYHIPAYLIFIYFIGDESVNGPKTKEEWLAAIQVMEKCLGLGRHKLKKYMADIFIDVKELKG